MKKIYTISFAVSLLFIACNKESETEIATPETTKIPTIIGIIDQGDSDTKTTYDGEGKFSWYVGDHIAVQVTKGGSYDKWTFTADASTPSSTFTSTLNGSSQNYAEAGWSLGTYAFYPKDSYRDLTFSNAAAPTVTLLGYTYDYADGAIYTKMSLIGEKVSSDGDATVTYRFKTATGALKLNFSGVPNVNALRLSLEHPSYPLCGTFNIAADNTIKAENYVSGKGIRTLEPMDGFSEAYIPLPIGTIPAGLVIKLRRDAGDYNLYTRIVTTKPIVIKKNTIVNLNQSLLALNSSVELIGDMTATPAVRVTISGTETVTFAVAATEDAGFAALAAADNGDYDQSGLATGDYYLCYKIYGSDGHAYIKNSIPFTKTLPKIALAEGDFSSNSVQVSPADGTGLAGLVDGTADGNHYHSIWSGTQYYDPTYGIWIDIDLKDGNTRTNYEFRYCTRYNANNHVKHFRIYASDDKSTWGDPVLNVENGLDGINANAGAWTNLFSFTTSTPKRYLRIAVVKYSNGADLTKSADWGSDQHYIHIAELELYTK